ncbi:hypothetical protein T492DRAFT_888458 [Pavlovales sp. CCMP2436]|nr:hypothetical protein T492DRAFT_888458 [Pavlovales sp. CCMP2436]
MAAFTMAAGRRPSLESTAGPTALTLTDYEPDRFRQIRRAFGIEARLNDQFVVKTCTAVEARTLRQMLPRYTTHLLAQIFGLYALDLYGRRLHFVVMANILAQTPLSQTQPQPQPHPQPQPQPQPQPEAEAEGSLSAATSSSSWGFGRSPRQLPQPEAQPQAQPQAQAQQPEARENIHER